MENKGLLEQKLELEYRKFCGRMMAKDKKFLLENAGKVYMMESLYKSVVEQCSGWTEEEIQMECGYRWKISHIRPKQMICILCGPQPPIWPGIGARQSLLFQ